jgi:hypothetical protein
MSKNTTGRTRWRRFAALAVPGFVATGVGMVLIAQGAMAVNFAVADDAFTLTADKIDGTNFAQYGSVDRSRGVTPHAVAPAVFGTATITNMCQSIVQYPKLLGGAPFSLKLTATSADATNLLVDVATLNADAEFTNFEIGQDAGTLLGGTTPTGTLGQSADTVILKKVKQTAYATTAGSFKLNGLSLAVGLNTNACA